MHELKIQLATALPLREISALTIRTEPSGALELLAVGDEDFAVIKTEFDANGALGDTFRYELFLPLVGTGIDLRGGSGFEGLACDGEGNVCVLQEEDSRVLVFDAELTTLRHVVELSVPYDTQLGREWYSEEGRDYRAEGLLLLDGGHLVVAKQKLPVCLIEFGPPNRSAVGIEPKTILSGSQRFEYPNDAKSTTLVPLAWWEFEETAAKTMTTLNDIAIDEDDRIYVLSSEAKVVARIDQRLRPGEKLKAKDSWSVDDAIPGGKKAKPEGLAVLPGAIPLIGFDSKKVGNNLIVLERAG
jgi:hypothetical protein